MKKKKLKVFVIPWHVSHQHRLFKLAERYPIEFYMLKNNVRKWPEQLRPLPEHIKWVTEYESGKYDLAILHIDQQCSNTNLGKSKMYMDLNDIITDIPKIVINHGSPMIPEYGYDEDIVINGGWITPHGDSKSKYLPGIKNMIGDNFMVVNSYEARDRWGWGYPVVHGMDSEEWWDLPEKEPRVITMISPGGMDKYYNRQLLSEIKSELRNKYQISMLQVTVDVKFEPDGDWDSYRNFIGQSLIYINCTKDSPMPSARTEAMMSGCCVLTSKYHDTEEFIENGVNGFIVPDNPISYVEMCKTLIENYNAAVKIGKKGKETMIRVCDMDRYYNQWIEIIDTIMEYGTVKAHEILDKKIDKNRKETYGKSKQTKKGEEKESNNRGETDTGTTKRTSRESKKS